MFCEGNFKKIIHQPSKYAARIAQAFTATDPSVRITGSQWVDNYKDLGEKPHLFTDGVGTISRELGDMIWEALCASRRDHGQRAVKPSAASTLDISALSNQLMIYSLVSDPFLGVQRDGRR
jgi:RNA-dependent RNA polymerase